MIDPFDTTLEDEIRKAKKTLYVVLNGVLLAYGTLVIFLGTAELYREEGTRLLLMAMGLCGARLWLRWTEPWIKGGDRTGTWREERA